MHDPELDVIIDKDMRARIKTSNKPNAYRREQLDERQSEARMKRDRDQELLKRLSKPLFDGK